MMCLTRAVPSPNDACRTSPATHIHTPCRSDMVQQHPSYVHVHSYLCFPENYLMLHNVVFSCSKMHVPLYKVSSYVAYLTQSHSSEWDSQPLWCALGRVHQPGSLSCICLLDTLASILPYLWYIQLIILQRNRLKGGPKSNIALRKLVDGTICRTENAVDAKTWCPGQMVEVVTPI